MIISCIAKDDLSTNRDDLSTERAVLQNKSLEVQRRMSIADDVSGKNWMFIFITKTWTCNLTDPALDMVPGDCQARKTTVPVGATQRWMAALGDVPACWRRRAPQLSMRCPHLGPWGRLVVVPRDVHYLPTPIGSAERLQHGSGCAGNKDTHLNPGVAARLGL